MTGHESKATGGTAVGGSRRWPVVVVAPAPPD